MTDASGSRSTVRPSAPSLGAGPRGGVLGVAAGAILFALPLAILAWRLVEYGIFAADAVTYPYGIDFGEGIVWQQLLLMPGPRMYGDIHAYPYIVFHYTPLFHFVVRLIAEAGADVLAGGRLVSVLSTLTACGAVALAGRRVLADQGFAAAPAWLVAGLAGLLGLAFKPIWFWSVLLKSDALALSLSLVGFVLMQHAVRSKLLGHVAMVLFVLAVYTKQTFIACPAAALLVWLVRDPRYAVRLGLTGLVLGAALLAWLAWMTDGGFLRHIFLYNINPYSWRVLRYNIWSQHPQALYAVLAALALARLLWWGRTALELRAAGDLVVSIRTDARAYRLALLLAYIVTATAMLVTMGKEGASFNYLMEWFAVASVAMATLFGWSIEMVRVAWPVRAWWRVLAACAVPLLLAAQLVVGAAPKVDAGPASQAKTRELDVLTEMVRAAPAPVLSDHMVVLMRAGREVPLESAIFYSLTLTGAWDQRPFVAMLASGAFAFIITDGDDGSNLYESRYTPEMRAAIRVRYPVKRLIGGHVIHSPVAVTGSGAGARSN